MPEPCGVLLDGVGVRAAGNQGFQILGVQELNMFVVNADPALLLKLG